MGKVTWGAGSDGRWYVQRGAEFLADFGGDGAKRAASILAASIAGGAHRTLETVYTIPADEPHPKTPSWERREGPAVDGLVLKPDPEAVAPDLSVLELSIPKLEAALETGAHDDDLATLYKAEEANKNRSGALDAIKSHAYDVLGAGIRNGLDDLA